MACFMSDEKKEIPFNPEIEVEEIEVTKQLYERYFPDDGIDYTKLRLSNIGKYSIVEPVVQEKIIRRMLNDLIPGSTITDACGNMGGMTISFAKHFAKVNVCEIVPLHCEILKNNIEVYGLDNVNIICGDFMKHMLKLKQDAIMFDPPWGGTDYKTTKALSLGLNNVNICCIIDRLLSKAKFIYMRVPTNYKFSDLKLIRKKHKIERIKLEPKKGNKSKIMLVFSSSSVGGRKVTRKKIF